MWPIPSPNEDTCVNVTATTFPSWENETQKCKVGMWMHAFKDVTHPIMRIEIHTCVNCWRCIGIKNICFQLSGIYCQTSPPPHHGLAEGGGTEVSRTVRQWSYVSVTFAGFFFFALKLWPTDVTYRCQFEIQIRWPGFKHSQKNTLFQASNCPSMTLIRPFFEDTTIFVCPFASPEGFPSTRIG